ncbi:hypothetical protein F0L74_31325 [Chitinophaga agrisoli]|uniref:YXWGXW repeat-containing protein n=1 Tax=Chitinophaga agrisoli TaxID=2607653 RepID=A0A5B2VQW6_9BACT|nr:DUF6600 domain-containing protein [Chitinophaga agrisoli]KAA2240642.1 hypothetical protein F0L74_31325 [Chitinophaga agrisoli]
MKSKITYYASVMIASLFFTTLFGSGCATAQVPQAGVNVSFSAFYDALSPYGQWMSYGNYGQVWVPNAGQDFQPYSTNGHWVYTDYGWTWASDYDWGWAPFHYGRWTYDNYYGWIWVPGEEWGPAWVSWRNSPDYYGWAPLSPGISIGVNYNPPTTYWSFVPCQYISSPVINRYYVDRSRNVTIIHNTTIINNVRTGGRTRYYRGPEVRDVERVTRRPITPVRVVDSRQPERSRVADNQMRIFRPQGEALRRPLADNRNRTTAPARVDNGNRVLPAPNNNNSSQPGVPGRTSRRVFDNNDNRRVDDNRVTPTPTTPNNIQPTTPATTPNRPTTTPAPDRSIPRRVFDNNNTNNRPITPATTPATPNRPTPTPAPDRSTPRRVFDQPNRPTPAPVPRPTPAPTPMPRTAPAPAPRPAPAPQPQSRPAPAPRPSPAPQRTFSNPAPRPTPAPRVQQQSAPRPAPAPRPANNDGGSRRIQRN